MLKRQKTKARNDLASNAVDEEIACHEQNAPEQEEIDLGSKLYCISWVLPDPRVAFTG